MDSEMANILDKFKEQVRAANRLEMNLKEKLISKCDDERSVTAVANGCGQLVDLKIHGGASARPAKVGSSITLAINRARSASFRLRSAAREKYLPGDASSDVVDEAFETHLKASDFEMIEINGSWDEYNRIAEGIEAYNEIVSLRVRFKKLQIKREIGNGTGTIAMSIDGSVLNVEVQADDLRQVGLERFARQTLEGIRRVEEDVAKVRRRKLEQITVNGFSAAEIVKKARLLADELT